MLKVTGAQGEGVLRVRGCSRRGGAQGEGCSG